MISRPARTSRRRAHISLLVHKEQHISREYLVGIFEARDFISTERAVHTIGTFIVRAATSSRSRTPSLALTCCRTAATSSAQDARWTFEVQVGIGPLKN